MKANAPEKIYIRPLPNPSDGYVGIAWDEPHKTMFEYTRTDAFIEKACEWLKNNASDYAFVDTDRIGNVADIDLTLVQDFKTYMKGE